MIKEFSSTDAELARCIKSRMQFELERFPRTEASKSVVREHMLELISEIIAEDF